MTPPVVRHSELRHLGPLGVLFGLVSLLLTAIVWMSKFSERFRLQVVDIDGWWYGPSKWLGWALAFAAAGLVATIALAIARRAHVAWLVGGGILCALAGVIALLSLVLSAVASLGNLS